MEGTRVDVLGEIKSWIDDRSLGAKPVQWLTAPAGTGKSAVAASIEKHLRGTRELGAVFYFVRAQPNRNLRAIVEIARQLALHNVYAREIVLEAFKEDPDITQKLPSDQYRRLIQLPLQAIPSDSPTLVIVLDALDECDREHMKTLLHLIGRGLKQLPRIVKFFITSRVEMYLKVELDTPEFKTAVHHRPLEKEALETVNQDIALYLKVNLLREVREYGIEDADWPGQESRDTLARMASGLFIWATTVILVIASSKDRDPEAQLEHILNSPILTNLDDFYQDILGRACPDGNPPLLKLFLSVLGALVVAQEPLTVPILARIISLMSNGLLGPVPHLPPSCPSTSVEMLN